jgi:hypothetical protein
MKRKILIFAMLLGIGLGSCSAPSNEMTDNYPTDYDLVYGLRQVLQYDPINVDGVNLVDKLDFFGSLRFTIHYEGGKVVAATFSNGEVPFSAFGFSVPSGRFECRLDTDMLPNSLVMANGDVIAQFKNGEFAIPFQLDHSTVSYKYTFKGLDSVE